MSHQDHTRNHVLEDANIRRGPKKTSSRAKQNGGPVQPVETNEGYKSQPTPGSAETALLILQSFIGELRSRLQTVTPELRGGLSKLLARQASLEREQEVLRAELDEKRERLKKEEELPRERSRINRVYLGLTTAALVLSGLAALGIGASFVRDYYGDPTILRGLLYASPIPLMGFVFKQLAFSLWPPDTSRRAQKALLIVALVATGVFLHSFSQRYARDLDAEDATAGFSVSSAPAAGEPETALEADNFKQIFLGQTLSEVVAATVFYWTFSLLVVPQTGQRWRYFRRAVEKLEHRLAGTEEALTEAEAAIVTGRSRIEDTGAAQAVLARVMQSLAESLSDDISQPQP